MWGDSGDLRWQGRWPGWLPAGGGLGSLMQRLPLHGALWMRWLVRLLGLACMLHGAPAAAATPPTMPAPVMLDALPAGPLGLHTQVLAEPAEATNGLTLQQALARLAAGDFRPSTQRVLSHGLGAPPVWVQLPLHNPRSQPVTFRLLTGTSWLDRLDVHLLQHGQPVQQWQAGDERSNIGFLVPVQGLAFELVLPPGPSMLLLRLQSTDPSVLPIELLPAEAVLHRERVVSLTQGLLAGFLLALITSYGLLWLVLRERSYFDYVVYVAGFLVLNLCHTGLGQAWLWPSSPGVGRYVILVTMVGFCCIGLMFARNLLDLGRRAPQVDRLLRAAQLAGAAGMLLFIVTGQQLAALRLAFGFTTLFSVGMLLLGLLAVRRRIAAGRSFLAAVTFSAAGAFVTTAAVLGWLPFNHFTYHAVALGVVMEATIWALMLALRLRRHQRDSVQARDLARRDPLTGLNNRRGFIQQAQVRWQQAAATSGVRLSVVMLDLDHFKQVNDRHGHAAGDCALVALSALLASSCRLGDVLARWGGEEFVLLLPDTGLAHAHALAERMRQRVESQPVMAGSVALRLTASFGVADCEPAQPGTDLETLLRTVDEQLYAAKRDGRNCVALALPAGVRRGAAPATVTSAP